MNNNIYVQNVFLWFVYFKLVILHRNIKKWWWPSITPHGSTKPAGLVYRGTVKLPNLSESSLAVGCGPRFRQRSPSNRSGSLRSQALTAHRVKLDSEKFDDKAGYQTSSLIESWTRLMFSVNWFCESKWGCVRVQSLVKLCCVASECASSFSVCTILQLHLFQSGILWCLLPNLFHYDYTLDEGGVEKSEESNQQVQVS